MVRIRRKRRCIGEKRRRAETAYAVTGLRAEQATAKRRFGALRISRVL
ncbi:hypothetical protein [Streptomyces sp. NPDC058694]